MPSKHDDVETEILEKNRMHGVGRTLGLTRIRRKLYSNLARVIILTKERFTFVLKQCIFTQSVM